MPGTPDRDQERVVLPPPTVGHRPAGWYVDPSDSARFRYWNGTEWENRTSERRLWPSEVEAEAVPWWKKKWIPLALLGVLVAGGSWYNARQDREEAIEELQNELGLTDAETDELVDSIDDLEGLENADENDEVISDVEMRTIRILLPALVDADPELDFEIDQWSDAQIRAITAELCQAAEADSLAEFMRWFVEVGDDDVVVAAAGAGMACSERLERLGF